MVRFHQTMDQHSEDVVRVNPDGSKTDIADIQWHPEGEPRIVLRENTTFVTMSDMESMLERLKKNVAADARSRANLRKVREEQ